MRVGSGVGFDKSEGLRVFLIYEKWPRENKNLKSSPDRGHENKRVLGKKLKSEHSKCCAAIEEKGPLTFKIVIKKCAKSFKNCLSLLKMHPSLHLGNFISTLKTKIAIIRKISFRSPKPYFHHSTPPKQNQDQRLDSHFKKSPKFLIVVRYDRY